MFDRLTSGLSTALKTLVRPRPPERGEHRRHGAARCGSRCSTPTSRFRVVKSFTEAIKARAIGVEVTKSLTPGQAFIKVVHEELVAAHGRAELRSQSARAAPGGRHARRTAGRRQDHDCRQARALADREAEQEGADGQHRRVSSGGDFAAADAGRSGGRGVCARRLPAKRRSRSPGAH